MRKVSLLEKFKTSKLTSTATSGKKQDSIFVRDHMPYTYTGAITFGGKYKTKA